MEILGLGFTLVIAAFLVGLMVGAGIAAWHLRQPERYPDLRGLRVADYTTFPTEPFDAVIEGRWFRVTLDPLDRATISEDPAKPLGST